MTTTKIDENPIGLLLRHPREVARRCLEEEGLKPLTVAALAAIAIGAAVFGGVVGTFRGDAQIAYAAIKMPLALLAALVLAVPAFHGIAASLGRPYPLRTVIALTLTAAGRAALVLFAFAPVLWLLYDLGLGYHAAALAAAGAYGLAGIAALGVLLRGLGEGGHRALTAIAFIGVFLAAGGQTSWVLRPYLVRPASDEVPFLRSIEGGFADALYRSSRSSVGLYDDIEQASRGDVDWDDTASGRRMRSRGDTTREEWSAPYDPNEDDPNEEPPPVVRAAPDDPDPARWTPLPPRESEPADPPGTIVYDPSNEAEAHRARGEW